MTTVALRVALLTAIWVGLWGDPSPGTIVAGVAVASAVVAVFGSGRVGTTTVRPWRALVLLGYFAWQLVVSTATVAVAVLWPRHRTHAGIIVLPLRGASDALATLIGHAVTLTPGTLTMELTREPPTLRIHVLDLRDPEQVRRSVRTLETLAVRAFGDADALAGLTVDDSEAWELP